MRFLVVSVMLFITACKRDNPNSGYWLKAEVVHTSDINCGRSVLNFNQDSAGVRMITDDPSLTYVVKEFPGMFNTIGNQVRVRVRKITPAESFACLTLGPNYPAIVVEEVRMP